jgi:hypothetical protein
VEDYCKQPLHGNHSRPRKKFLRFIPRRPCQPLCFPERPVGSGYPSKVRLTPDFLLDIVHPINREA